MPIYSRLADLPLHEDQRPELEPVVIRELAEKRSSSPTAQLVPPTNAATLDMPAPVLLHRWSLLLAVRAESAVAAPAAALRTAGCLVPHEYLLRP